MTILLALDLVRGANENKLFALGVVGYLLVLYGLFTAYLGIFENELYVDTKRMTLLFVVLSITIALEWVCYALDPRVMPSMLAVLLCAALISPRQALSVNVSLGGTTAVHLGNEGNLTNLDAVQVMGSRVINRVDVQSTETSTILNREDIARMPVDQSLTSVALLAPGVVSGNASFGGISFGGSSVAENSVFINGLNVTDFYRRQSFSAAPFAIFQEFQVKTGGYSVEFGRSTGGVINAVTRSGSNELKGGMELTF